MSLAVDTTKRNKKYTIVYTIVALFCIALFVVNIVRYYYFGVLDPVALFFYAMIAWIVYLRCKPTYDIYVERKFLKIVKHTVFGTTKVYEIPYREIAGIFSYQPKLMRTIKFRYSYRLNSALDARTLWTLAWRRQFEGGSEANVRIYFKASKQVIDALSEKMPNRVNVPEEMADFNMLVKEGVIVNNKNIVQKAESQILEKPLEQIEAEEKAASDNGTKETGKAADK